MSRPNPSLTRLILVADRDHRRGLPADSPVRRYRLARVRLDGPSDQAERYAHMRRAFD
jgi:hypothetical protein